MRAGKLDVENNVWYLCTRPPLMKPMSALAAWGTEVHDRYRCACSSFTQDTTTGKVPERKTMCF